MRSKSSKENESKRNKIFSSTWNHVSANEDWMKVYVIQNKNGIIINAGVCKELDDRGSSKNDYMWNPSTCNCEYNKACKSDRYLDIKNSSFEERVIGKLVLECEDEILNTTETLLNHKKIAFEKIIPLIHTIPLVITCLLLLFVICVRCYFYITKYQPKQKHSLRFNDTSIKLGDIRY